MELFNNKITDWKVAKIYLVGFSFGALPAILSKATADKIILIEPFVNWELHKEHGETDLKHTLAFLRDAYKNVYRIDGDSFFVELNNLAYPKSIAPIVVVKGIKDDKVISKSEIKWLMDKYNASYQEFDGGHTANLPEEIFQELFT